MDTAGAGSYKLAMTMEILPRLAIIGAFVIIVASLASALYHLSRSGDSQKLARALTVRIGLSVVLFVLLMLAWRFGLIVPHGMGPRVVH
jgi:Protein of unknown function (DUF2909)